MFLTIHPLAQFKQTHGLAVVRVHPYATKSLAKLLINWFSLIELNI